MANGKYQTNSRQVDERVKIIFLMMMSSMLVISACSAQVQTRTNAADGKVMVHVPAGEFRMGTTDGEQKLLVDTLNAQPTGFVLEKPAHTATVGEFWIDREPVTNAEYKKFLDANPTHPVPDTDLTQLKGWSWDSTTRNFQAGRENLPVVLVDWNDANDFCKWAGGRLPTEAEWEKAARGTDGRMYPWGDTWDKSKTAYGESGSSDAVAVGSFPTGASPYGANDMVGNVWQWTSSLLIPYPYNATDGREDPTKTGDRVIRGGMFGFGPAVSRTNVRNALPPTDKVISLGIRCAQ